MQRLTNITEQLKTKDCKNVIVVLTSLTKSDNGSGNSDSSMYALLRRWKQIDVKIMNVQYICSSVNYKLFYYFGKTLNKYFADFLLLLIMLLLSDNKTHNINDVAPVIFGLFQTITQLLGLSAFE